MFKEDRSLGRVAFYEIEYMPNQTYTTDNTSYGPVTFSTVQKPEGDVIVKADRFNSGKAPVSMVDPILIEKTAKVLQFGAEKYDRNNWRKGLPYTEVCDSLLRHVYAFLTGENTDNESGQSHLGHAACNIMFLLRYLEDNREDLDDRYKGE